MKLTNFTRHDFTTLFGKGMAARVNQAKARVILAVAGKFPELDALGEVAGTVIEIDPFTGKLLPDNQFAELAMILYPDVILAQADSVATEEQAQQDPVLRARRDRFVSSYVEHELVHWDQQVQGRLKVIGMGLVEWEGVLVEIGMTYTPTYPWEQEAYIAQFAYLAGGDLQKGREAYLRMLQVQADHDATQHGLLN